MRLVTALLLVTLAVTLGAVPLGAADLVEPWARGLSNLELATAGSGHGSRSASSLIGGGLTDRLSLGLITGTERDGETSASALLLYSQPLGRAGEVDVWCETSLDVPLDGTGCGLEWSRTFSAFVPYARLTFDWHAPSDSLAPLAGIMMPVTPALGLHVELSLEAAEDAGRPLRIAVGPNWELSPRLELIPELAWMHGSAGEDSLQAALCLVMDISR